MNLRLGAAPGVSLELGEEKEHVMALQPPQRGLGAEPGADEGEQERGRALQLDQLGYWVMYMMQQCRMRVRLEHIGT